MKLLHLGDLHLGKSLGEYDLIDDQKFILDQILNMVDRKKIDAVLIAGDVYDKAIPSEAATRLLNSFLSSLSDKGVDTFMISGNHDSDERLNFGSSLFEKNRIYISSLFNGSVYRQTLTDQYGEVCICLLPFVKASQVRHFYPDEKIESYDDAFRVVIGHAGIDPSKRNVLVAHQFVTGKSQSPVLGGSEGVAAQSVGLVEMISCDHFNDFDYVALGHIHSPQAVGRETVRYSGSILKYSLSEVLNSKSVPIITLGEKGDVEVELEPLRPMRDLRHIKGRIKDLLAKENIVSPDDFMYVTLTEENIIDDVMKIFRQVYPNTVKIDYDNSHTRQIDHVDLSEIGNKKPFTQLISEFYKKMYGKQISEEELELMKQVAQEAGVLDETD